MKFHFLYPRPGGSTASTCTGTCNVTNCKACYYSKTVQTCPKHCMYGCGENPSPRCLKRWSQCVKKGLKKVGDAYFHVWCVYVAIYIGITIIYSNIICNIYTMANSFVTHGDQDACAADQSCITNLCVHGCKL